MLEIFSLKAHAQKKSKYDQIFFTNGQLKTFNIRNKQVQKHWRRFDSLKIKL